MATVETSSPIYAGFGGMGDMFGGGMGIWGFLIIAMLMMGGGWGGFGGLGGFGGWGNNDALALAALYNNRNDTQYATSAEVQRGFDNQNTIANQREILAAVSNGTAQSVAATNQTFHDTLMFVNDKYDELQRDNAEIRVGQANALANQNQCCCDTKQLIQAVGAQTNANIAQNRYDAAMNTAAINANTTAQTQKILDAMQQNKIDALQSRVNQLETQNLMAGVVKYPMGMTYTAGNSPFCNCGNGWNGYPVYA